MAPYGELDTGEARLGRDRAQAMDLEDPLASFRERFEIPDERMIYWDGSSLGRLPRQTLERLRRVVEEEWGDRLIRSWTEGWMELPTLIGDRIGTELLGAAPGQVLVADSTTVCIYKLAAAALAAQPGRDEIVTDVDNFPTDRYVLEALAHERGLRIRWIEADPLTGPTPAEVAAVVGPRTALVAFSHIAYRSGFVLDMESITQAAHAAGALMFWDLCHSVGVRGIELDRCGVDLAVGCTYKYLNGGPGAPAFLYIASRHQGVLRQPIWGWLGRSEPFEMAQGYEPAPGIVGAVSGTPPVLGLTGAGSGVDLVIEAGIRPICSKAAALTELAIELSDGLLAPYGVSVGSTRDAARRGAHVSLVHPDAQRLCVLLAQRDVIADFRMPDSIRVGLSPLTTRFVDVWDGVEALRSLLAAGTGAAPSAPTQA